MAGPVSLDTTQKVDVVASFLPPGSVAPGPVTYALDNPIGTLVPLASDPNSTTFVASAVGSAVLTGTSGSLTDTVAITVTAAVATSLVLTAGTPVAQ
jgi:hypothetical protein